jgi:hypothetical protein
MDTGGFGIPIIMRQMNGGLFNHSVHLSNVVLCKYLCLISESGLV